MTTVQDPTPACDGDLNQECELISQDINWRRYFYRRWAYP